MTGSFHKAFIIKAVGLGFMFIFTSIARPSGCKKWSTCTCYNYLATAILDKIIHLFFVLGAVYTGLDDLP